MTIALEIARQRHEGNGATTSFTTGFAFQENSQVRVIFTDTDGVDTEWVLNTHYTLTGAGTGSPGTVTVKTTPTNYTPAADEFLTIILDVAFTQSLNGSTIDALPGSAVEEAYDKIWLALNQLREKLSRALVSSETGEGGEPVVASWLPVLAAVADGSRRVFQVVSWSGGVGAAPASGIYLGASGYVSSISDAVDVRGPAGASGSGSGDMLASNNLSDVASAATSFGNIKQNATTSATGVVEIATDAEALAKVASTALICSNLAALILDEDNMVSDSNTKVPTQQSVKAYVDGLVAGISGFPSGTAMIFVQTSAPTGWTKSTTHNDKALRIVSGAASSGGSVNFSTLFGRTGTDAVTLLTANLPTTAVTDVSGTSTSDASFGGTSTALTSITVTKAGTGNSFTPAIDMRVAYVDCIIATKN